MRQYLDVLKNILENGVEKESGRANMPNVIGISGAEMRMDMNKGYPLLTTKKMFWKGVIHELLWILRGETNIKYLVDNDVNIWNGDAYRWYQKHCEKSAKQPPLSIEEFIEVVKITDNISKFEWFPDVKGYSLGDLGKVYGHQMRNQNGVDQLTDVIKTLQTNPYSRYHIIDLWNKSDFSEMALPPCHLLYHFMVRPFTDQDRVIWLNDNYLMYDQKPWTIEMVHGLEKSSHLHQQYGMPKFFLDLSMYQRSCDTLLGVPFNIASMSAFLMIMSKLVGMEPGVARWIGGDVHLYTAHISAAQEQLTREPFQLPKLAIRKQLKTLDDVLGLTINDFDVVGYHYHPKIKQELFTGYKR